MAKPAYCIDPIYNQSEMNSIREIVLKHVQLATQCTTLQLEEYHNYVSQEKHKEIGNKKLRVLTHESAQIIEDLDGTKRLLKENPGYRIGEVVYNSREKEQRSEFYFRLVRPNKPGDVGPPHCDYWFDEAMGTGWGIGNTIKYWIPIITESGLNGLYFYPEAPSFVPFKILEIEGLNRPVIDIPIAELGSPLLPSPSSGQALRFRDDVLHAGAPNRGRFTRVSMEITLVKSPM